ncbi:MAG: FAD-binding oxidoreductase [Acidobacteriota bacterium]
MPESTRRWNGWGFEGESLAASEASQRWLEARIGRGDPLASVPESAVAAAPPRPVPDLGVTTASDLPTRLRHACGGSFPDLITLRTGAIAALPDAVAFPASHDEVVCVLSRAAAAGVAVVIRGGGTSVVGGVTVRAGQAPVVVLSLERLSGLLSLDETSLLATFAAGTLGPEVEAALAPRRLRLGHEPQSFELSTVGGWAATRSAGQRSTGVGKIDDLVAGLELATAAGAWRLAAQPASAAGPELRRLLIGSEGRLGVITAVTLRVRLAPEHERGLVVLLPDWDAGASACRAIMQGGVPVEVLRLSDPDESSFAASTLHLPAWLTRAGAALLRRSRHRHGCLLLLGWAGGRGEVAQAREQAGEIFRAYGGVSLGARGWRSWRRDRFRHPYLRDALLDAGWGVDTLETAATWAQLPALRDAVRTALLRAAEERGLRLTVLCHLSHAYRDGASLYFTFLWPLQAGRELVAWESFKSAATEALLAAGGTISHHHGVGTMHAPYLEQEVGPTGVEVLRRLAATLDPQGILNPGVLLQAAAGSSGEDS